MKGAPAIPGADGDVSFTFRAPALLLISGIHTPHAPRQDDDDSKMVDLVSQEGDNFQVLNRCAAGNDVGEMF